MSKGGMKPNLMDWQYDPMENLQEIDLREKKRKYDYTLLDIIEWRHTPSKIEIHYLVLNNYSIMVTRYVTNSRIKRSK